MEDKKKHTNYLLLLLLCLSFFTIGQWQALSLPYFWDELGVYAPSALYLVDNGVSIMPEALPAEYSRGHPMLCVFLFSIGMKLFGATPFVAHLIALFFSAALVVATYLGASSKTNPRTGFWAASLLMVQPVFIAQSTLVLPEILLAFFIVAAFFAYLQSRWLLYVILGSLAMLTKETAIVLPFACFLHSFLIPQPPPILSKQAQKQLPPNFIPNAKTFLLAKSLFIFAPLMAFALFLIVQKVQNGWFFFPYHTDLISLNPADLWDKSKKLLKFLLFEQGRFLWPILLIFHFLILESKRVKKEEQQEVNIKFGLSFDIGPLFIYLFAFAAFFVLNFFMERYTLLFFPILCLLVAEILNRIGKQAWGIWLILMILPLLNLTKNKFTYDYDLTHRKAIEIQQKATNILEETISYDTKTYSSFPMFMGLKDKRFGYSKENFTQLSGHFTDSCQIVVKSKPGSTDHRFKEEEFNLIWSEEDPIMSIWIYEKKK